jgi:TIR domain
MALFINYRREDSDGDTRAIYNRLARETDESNLFLDVEAIGAGENWRKRIDNTLKKVQAVVVVIGPRWLELLNARTAAGSFDSVRTEIAASIDKPDVAVIPVLVNGARLPAQSALPEDIRGLTDLNAIEVRGSAWKPDMDRLVKALRQTGALPTSRRRWIARAAAAAVAVAAVAAFFAARKQVPDIPKEMTSRYARQLVRDAGLKFAGRKIGQQNEGTVDIVSDQRPSPGSHLFAWQSVEVDFIGADAYWLVCRNGPSFAGKPGEDGFKFEKYDLPVTAQMKEGTCSWIGGPMRPTEANFIKPLGFADGIGERFHKAPGGFLAFCAKSQYDESGKSPRLAALSVQEYMRKDDNGQLVPRMSDFICIERFQ